MRGFKRLRFVSCNARCVRRLGLLFAGLGALSGAEWAFASGNLEVQPSSLIIDCTGTAGGASAASGAMNALDVPPQGTLDLSNPQAVLGPIRPDQITIRFRTARAAALHADRMTVAPHDRGRWMDHAAAARPARLPIAVQGLRPQASGHAKALRTLNTHAQLRAEAATLAGGKTLAAHRSAAVSRALAGAFQPADPMGIFHAKVVPGTDLRALCLELMRHPEVVYASPSPVCRPMVTPNDPLYPRMWNLPMINMPAAWDVSGNTLGTVRVCLVDSGVRITHSELAGRIADPTDVYLDNGDAFADADPSNDDPDGHGTACAGIMASIRGNGLLVAGIAPVTIIPVNGSYTENGNTYIANYTDGIYWGVDHGASVVSLSLGGTHSDPYPEEVDAINYAQAHDVVVCAAAGNDDGPAEQTFPSALPYCIQVGAVDQDGIRVRPSRWYWGSNYGSTLDVCAPGQGDVGLWDSILTLGNLTNTAYVNYFNGTSAATPHVAGLAALLKHINPALTGSQIRSCIESTARDRVGAPEEDIAGRDAYHGYGLIDAAAAAQCARDGGHCLTIRNSGSSPVQINAIEAPAWAHVSPAAAFSIPAGASQPVSVTACAQCSGSGMDGSMVIYSNDPGQPAIAIPVHVDCASCQPLTGCQAASEAVLAGQSTSLHALPGGSDTVEWFTDSCGGTPIEGGATPTVAPTQTTIYYARSANPAAGCVGSTCCSVEVAVISGDLTVQSLTGPSTSGAGQTISLVATTRNGTTSTLAGASVTRLYWSTNTTVDGDDIEIGSCSISSLEASQSSSGTVTATIAPDTATGTYYVIAQADADNDVTETNEANNTRTLTVKVGPDLTVSTLTGPSTSGAGQVVTLTAIVKNGTTASPAAASTLRFYWSTNTTLDGGDAEIASCGVAALAANQSGAPCSIQLDIPTDIVPATYYVFAKADADDAVAETSETNNTRYRSIKVGPDLSVSALTVPSTSGAGQTIAISATVKNGSTSSPAGPFFTRLYWSTNSTLEIGDTEIASWSVDGLGAGESTSFQTALTIPLGTASATYYVIARTDDGDAVLSEVSETNNIRYAPIKIGADLTIPTLAAPSTSGMGQVITVTATVKNGVTSSPTGPFVTRVYLSTNTTIDAGDSEIGSCSTADLQAGQSTPCSLSVAITSDIVAGSYYLIAKADADDAVVSETSESNNTKYASIKIGAELTISAMTNPNSVVAGQAITVTATTKNGATASPAEAFFTRLYWSTNSALDASDVEIGSCSIAELGPNASTTCTFAVTVPQVSVRAVYYLIAKADADGVVVETSETNNTLSRFIVVSP
ncbi:MAG: S8 family serine peptidase [Phycisphaerae bacterium]|nr:S8 family serine peptidase [Phycisphaerae bacterium]